MTEQREAVMTGGCQCGAVRYALYAEPYNIHICHCRMCQKAFGSFFAPLASIKLADFAWTRGAPSIFVSSPPVERGFCNQCGTPLTFRFVATERLNLSIGSFDEPAKVVPEKQFGAESRLPYLEQLHRLPAQTTEETIPADLLSQIKTRQHPDRTE